MKRASVKSRTGSIRPADVGSDDMRVARQWSSLHLGIGKKDGGRQDLSELPFPFVFGGKPSADLLGGWKAARGSRVLDHGRTEHTSSWTDPESRLRVRCVAVEYHDFPVIEWTVWFRNEGATGTSVLSDIQAMNAALPGAPADEGLLHWFVGSRARKEDFQPRVAALTPGVPLHFGSTGGRPSDGTMPYFNLDFGNRGCMVAVGWPGQWSARIEGAGDGARMRSGQSATRIALRPGEEIRTPLMDTCASGGRRLDLETLRRSVPLLRTDYRFEPTGTQGQHYAISFWIPFSGSGLYQDTPYVMRSHMNSCFGYAVDFRNQKPDWALLKRMTAEWRLIAEDGLLGDYYPLTDYSLAEDVWMAWQFHRPGPGTGFVQAFRRPECSVEAMRFKLRGLDPKAQYRLTDLDKKQPVVLTGSQLMTKGTEMRLPERPGAAIVIYQQA